MSDLTEFLLARLADDEHRAKRARHYGFEAWEFVDGELLSNPPPTVRVTDVDRVLSECEAKRRIVELHRPSDERNRWCAHCRGSEGAEYPCLHSRILGTIYADHPDYRAEWRP